MSRNLLERAERYALNYDYVSLENDDIRAKSPILFVVLGEEVKSSIPHMKQTMGSKLMNAEGIVYFYISHKEEEEIEGENVITLSLPLINQDEKSYRGSIEKQLFQEQAIRIRLGEKIGQVKETLLAQSKLFKSWEQVYVSLVVSASDPLSVLLPDISVFVQKKLAEAFKQVFMDLFVTIEERGGSKAALSQALTMSFLKELDVYQSKKYSYKKPIEVLPEGILAELVYEKQLFDLAYILTDKKQNGQKIREAQKEHYEAICAVNLLKNRHQKNRGDLEANEQYNHGFFRHHIACDDEARYASAKLAKVRKPGAGIYMAGAYHIYQAYIEEITYKHKATEELLGQAGLSENKLSSFTATFLRGKEKLKDIHSLMSHGISFKELQGVSFKDAQTMLYGSACENFFNDNFKKPVLKTVKSREAREAIEKYLLEEFVNNSQYGPYALSSLFQEENRSKLEVLKSQIKERQRQLERELDEKENELVGQKIGTGFSMFNQKYIRGLKSYLVDEIYGLKYSILQEEVKAERIDSIKDVLENLYESIKVDMKKLENIGRELKKLMETANRFEEAYLVQNVNEYYEKVVQAKIQQLKKVRGENFFYEERFMGSSLALLKSSEDEILGRLFEIEEKYFLSDEVLFNVSFEEELLARSNTATTYENEEIVSKSDLYSMLYQSLEENSKPCVYLDTAQMTHAYEEKYFFADRKSEFISYAYDRDKASRSYKLGCISEQKKSGIEKVQLIGGFKLSDLMLTKAASRYYEIYLKEGYSFHSSES